MKTINYKNVESDQFTINYFSNINEDMQRALTAAHVCHLPRFSGKKLTEDELNSSLTCQFSREKPHFVIPEKTFELTGYQFEGWTCVRDTHHVMPLPGTMEQSSIYAGKNSIIHKTGVANPNFLWKAGDRLTPLGKIYDFYAQWTPIEFSVFYKAKTIWNEPIQWSQPIGIRSIEQGYETKVIPNLPRYKFIGWEVFSDGRSEGLSFELPEIMPGIGEITIFAVFDRDY